MDNSTSEKEEDEFDSKEFDYPIYGEAPNGPRSALKKPGKGRSGSTMLLKVNFQEVHLREYGMVLGDNPSVSHGAPVQLDWEPQEIHDPVHIDNYDKARSLWRAKDRRGFLLNAHKRVKILFAAGYTIDEIAKVTMEMKELRQQRAESLKTQGMMTGAILALLSGAAETTGQTVRAVTILPNAIAGAGKVMITGTSTAIMGAGAGMVGLTDKVVKGTTTAVQKGTTAITGTALKGLEGTGKVIVGTGNLMVKGTTGLVQGTGKVVAGTGKVGIDVVKGTGKVGMDVVKGTGKVGMDVVKGTGKVGMDVVKGTGKVGSAVVLGTGKVGMDVVKGTGKVGMDVVIGTGKVGMDVVKGTGKVGMDVVKGTGKVGLDVVKGTGKVGMDVVKGTGKVGIDVVKGTSNVMVGGTMAMVKGTGVLFSGTANAMKTSTKRLSRMVSLDHSSHHGSDNDNDMDCSDTTGYRGRLLDNFGIGPSGKQRISMPVSKIPKPVGMSRQRSLDSAHAEASEGGAQLQLTEELLEMQEYLRQMEGMDEKMVQEIINDEAEKQAAREKAMAQMNSMARPAPVSRGVSVPVPVASPTVSEPGYGTKNRGFSMFPGASPTFSEPGGTSKNRGFSLFQGGTPPIAEDGARSRGFSLLPGLGAPRGIEESPNKKFQDMDSSDNSFHSTREE